jgi:hypothetical protein
MEKKLRAKLLRFGGQLLVAQFFEARLKCIDFIDYWLNSLYFSFIWISQELPY